MVAFANGIGGKIIFGIADKTREVVGFDKEDDDTDNELIPIYFIAAEVFFIH